MRSGFGTCWLAVIVFLAAPAAAQTVITNCSGTPLSDPRDVAVDVANSGNLVVADRGNGVVRVFDTAGTCLKSMSGSDMTSPFAVVVDPLSSNQVIATDSTTSGIYFFDTSGTFIGKIGGPGTDPGQVNGPFGIAIDSTNDDFVIADNGNNRAQIYDRTHGIFLTPFGTTAPYPLSGPAGVAIDPATGDILIVEETAKRVQVFTPSGTVGGPTSLGVHGVGILKDPTRITVDAAHGGRILVSDQGSKKILVFSALSANPPFRLIGEIDGPGGGRGAFGTPAGLAVDTADAGALAVADASANQVDLFAPAVTPFDIPTLGFWALVAMALLLAGAGWRVVRR